MLGRASAQEMEAAMHIRVFVLIIVPHNIEHARRLLRTGCAVEVNERMAVDALAQDRKILSQRRPIDLALNRFVHAILSAKRGFAPSDS